MDSIESWNAQAARRLRYMDLREEPCRDEEARGRGSGTGNSYSVHAARQWRGVVWCGDVGWLPCSLSMEELAAASCGRLRAPRVGEVGESVGARGCRGRPGSRGGREPDGPKCCASERGWRGKIKPAGIVMPSLAEISGGCLREPCSGRAQSDASQPTARHALTNRHILSPPVRAQSCPVSPMYMSPQHLCISPVASHHPPSATPPLNNVLPSSPQSKSRRSLLPLPRSPRAGRSQAQPRRSW